MILPVMTSSGKRRRGEQAFHRPAFAFPRDGQRGDHDHGHGQDDSHQTGNDVVLGDAVGIVFEVNSHFDRPGPGREIFQRSGQVAIEGRARDLIHDLHGGADGGGIGGVGLDEHCRSVSADQPAREVRRQIQDELHLAASQQTTCGFLGFDVIDDLEVAAVFHRMDEPARKGAVVRGEHGDRQILRIRVDREAEENELKDRECQTSSQRSDGRAASG